MKSIVSDRYDGHMRRLFARVCVVCHSEFWVPKHVGETYVCCSVACRGKNRRRRVSLTCAQCGRIFERSTSQLSRSRSGLRFCTRDCKDKAQRLEGLKLIHPPHYGTASFNKDQLLRERGRVCQVCGLTEWLGEPIPLVVDHIDGNAYNGAKENLRLICPNCDALTLTYRGRNHGRGRQSRVKPDGDIVQR
jgi:hypothetical protein